MLYIVVTQLSDPFCNALVLSKTTKLVLLYVLVIDMSVFTLSVTTVSPTICYHEKKLQPNGRGKAMEKVLLRRNMPSKHTIIRYGLFNRNAPQFFIK